jgi:hypothetical protein
MRYDNKNTLYYLPRGHISFKRNLVTRRFTTNNPHLSGGIVFGAEDEVVDREA